MKNPLLVLAWTQTTLNDFVEQLLWSKGKLTVAAYKSDVTNFLVFLESRKVKRAAYLKSDNIISYLGHCKAAGKSDASINRYYMAIRAYCKFLKRAKLVDVDLSDEIAPPRCKVKAPRIPTIAEIEAIIHAPNIETESGMRDKAILELLYSSGLRASELCDLQLEDITDISVLVTCGKGEKTRAVPLTVAAGKAIKEYVEKYRGREAGYLFLTVMRKRLRRQLLGKIVEGYAKKAGVQGVTTHTLRHACATHMLDYGADIRLIQEILGHSSIASTQRYTHLSSNKMQTMFHTFHPRKELSLNG